MKINFTYTLDDYYAIQRAKTLSSRFASWRVPFLGLLIGFNILIGSWTLYEAVSVGRPLEWWMFVNIGLGIILLLAFTNIDKYLLRLHLRRYDLEGKPVEITINDDGVLTEVGPLQTETKWAGIVKMQEIATHYLLWINKAQAFSIPKRTFASTVEEEAFRKKIEIGTGNQFTYLGKRP